MAFNRYFLERPKTRARIFALVLDGKSDQEVATAIATKQHQPTRQAITAFRKRHAEQLAPVIQAVEAAVVDLAIKDKEERIRRLSWMWDQMLEVYEKQGLVLFTRRRYGDVEVEEEAFNVGLTKEMRSVLNDVAAELGQRQKIAINVNDNRVINFIELIGSMAKEETE